MKNRSTKTSTNKKQANNPWAPYARELCNAAGFRWKEYEDGMRMPKWDLSRFVYTKMEEYHSICKSGRQCELAVQSRREDFENVKPYVVGLYDLNEKALAARAAFDEKQTAETIENLRSTGWALLEVEADFCGLECYDVMEFHRIFGDDENDLFDASRCVTEAKGPHVMEREVVTSDCEMSRLVDSINESIRFAIHLFC